MPVESIMSFIQDFVKWCMLEEGFNLPHKAAWNNNNPLNLNSGPRCKGRDANGHGIYASIADGFADAEELVEEIIRKHPEITLSTFFAGERDPATGAVIAGGYSGFAPAADPRGANAPLAYAEFVGKGLGIGIAEALLPKLPLPSVIPSLAGPSAVK